MIPIVPAIIPKSAEEILATLPRLSFSHEIHIDVVDGKFVPFTSWPYCPAGEPKAVSHATDRFTLEVDLMVEDPLIAADSWIKAGADMLVFHIESIELESFSRFVETAKVSVGVSALNSTSFDVLKKYAAVADYVQLMGIAKIGAQGQPFDESVLERIKEIKSTFPKLPITIDGSVNKNTIKRLLKAGADRFICGSAIVGAENPYEAHAELLQLTTNN
jgi:ribulose-phosphate 3-epimerase